MRILVLFAHPLETSFLASLHMTLADDLRLRQHRVDDLDLYAEKFNPVLSRQTYIDYLDTHANRAQAGPYIDRLLAAEALILISPVWHDGFPAILKGFFDCVFLPGVSFTLERRHFSPALHNIKRNRGNLLLWSRASADSGDGRSATAVCQAQFRRSNRTRRTNRFHWPLQHGYCDAPNARSIFQKSGARL
ncbi:MAG TPA: NAD(P)H-dependent oxidoreductase [Roseiarcus sp.]|nr:NAD(P)H-dependent oxidoreductase [Roseiarcus sp.]